MIPRIYLNTRAVHFFINRYKAATLRDAVELAARSERDILLKGFHDYCTLPIDVESIAKRKGFIISDKSCPMTIENDAKLSLHNDKFLLRIKPGAAAKRDRFTIAHEIGHTLFFEGTKHQIGLLNKKEIEAEDFICNLFASALLMPSFQIQQFIQKIADGSPWELFIEFENASRTFGVSLPALVGHIGWVRPKVKFSFIALCLRYFVNKFTRTDPCLRVDICSPLGELNKIRTWNNRSARGLNLISAENLLNSWTNGLGERGEITGGRYTLDSANNIVRATHDCLNWIPENLNVSIFNKGKWYKKDKLPMLASNCLYSRKGWREDKAYIISIIKSSNLTYEYLKNVS
jgi:Zn-dependent peptidase ImmA (M78 family)